ncbi:pyruvate formate-lyase-activating protein [Clostridium peptidivorans]|uniref:pyruvate formate-lyase-activating protein n=1 Tax=Clostridium peptidivorans TaxID=100174 RepID=UPI000BE42A55|nr:pyruvate formate-lyase-activating protein [Clostridium peptidivorans]
MTKGYIHSTETMGLVDGPGIRTVVFFQGCVLRCAYCHNPDTWSFEGGQEVSPQELLSKVLRFKPYFEKSGGGVTCSGGEPLMQPKFLLEFLKLCKENNIHTTIDTSGVGAGNYEEILKYVDLVLLDVKHYDRDGYEQITEHSMDKFNEFTESILKSNVPIWIRHVVVPGITDSEEHMIELKKFISKFKNLEKVELLPYHTLGVNKYEKLGIPYKLDGIEAMEKERLKVLSNLL